MFSNEKNKILKNPYYSNNINYQKITFFFAKNAKFTVSNENHQIKKINVFKMMIFYKI